MPRKRHKNKRYGPELKIAVVEAYFSGKGSMAELAKKYGISDESRVRGWLKSYNSHRKFKRHSAARGALYMTKGKKTTQRERAEIVAFCLEHSREYSEQGVSRCCIKRWSLPMQRPSSTKYFLFFHCLLDRGHFTCSASGCCC